MVMPIGQVFCLEICRECWSYISTNKVPKKSCLPVVPVHAEACLSPRMALDPLLIGLSPNVYMECPSFCQASLTIWLSALL